MHASDPALMARLFLLPVAIVIDPFALVLVFGICLRMGWLTDPALTGPGFAAFGNPLLLSVAAILYILHVFADKIPPIGHLFDALGILIKPIAAALVGFWLAHKFSTESSLPWYAVSVAALAGIPATYGLQLARTKARAGMSLATFGLLHPIVSAFENVFGLLFALAFALHPLLGVFLAVAVLLPIGSVFWGIARIAAKSIRKLKTRTAGRRSFARR